MDRDKLTNDLWDMLDDKLVIVGSDIIDGKTEAVAAILAHPHIARALTLLDRVGDAAADALIKGEAAVVKRDERDDLRRIAQNFALRRTAQNFADELGRISAAIGTDEFMPEGAPVPLETQVLRMKAALDRARSEVLDLRYVIAGVFLEENRRDISVQAKWKSALKAMTDVIVDGSVVSQGYAERIKRDAMLAAGRLDREGGR